MVTYTLHIFGKFKFSIPAFYLLAFLPVIIVNAQERVVNSVNESRIILRHPIPLKKGEKDYYSLKDEIANIISATVRQLFIDELAVLIEVDSTDLKENNRRLTEMIVYNLSRLKKVTEALVLVDVTLNQEKTEAVANEGYFSSDNLSVSDYIQTSLNIKSYYLDIKTGNNLGELNLEIREFGRSEKRSKKRAVKTLRERLITELKHFYWLSADVDTVIHGKLITALGIKDGIKKGYIFELVRAEQSWLEGDELISQPAGPVGLVQIEQCDSTRSRLRICRQWKNYDDGGWIVEHFNPVYTINLFCVPPVLRSYFNLSLQLSARPVQTFDYGGGLQIFRLRDTLRDDDYGFGFSGFGVWRFINHSFFDIGSKFEAGLDFPLKQDFVGNDVVATLFYGKIGLLAEMMINRRMDFVVQTDFRLSSETDEWSFSDGEESFPAVWEEAPPLVKNTGWVFSMGVKFFVF